MKVGFIGLGIMGSRMAANVQTAGHALIVHNRTKSKADALVASGATYADTPAAVAAAAEVVITVLAHPQAVTESAFGDDGFLDGMKAGSIWVNGTTGNPAFARAMDAAAQERGIRYLDAPVGGSKDAAASAKLTFIVGGEAADVEAATPLLQSMAQKIVHAGPAGMGTALKLVLNNLLAVQMAGFAEALHFGESMGIARETLLNVLVGGPVVAPFMAGKKAFIASDDFSDTHFPLKWMHKDLHMVAMAAYDAGAPMPVSNAAKEAFQHAVAEGLREMDFSAIVQLYTGNTEE